MNHTKVLDIGSRFGMGCDTMFDPWGGKSFVPTNLKEAEDMMPSMDFVVFGGGADIHPQLYGHRNVGSYGIGETPSFRDRFEHEVFYMAKEAGIPMLGLCRGAQLLCALNGGSLLQDVEGHANGFSGHDITTADSKDFAITSAHHQMMYPGTSKHELIAWAVNLTRSRIQYDSSKIKALPSAFLLKEPEIVYFPESKCLAVQGHPEWMDEYAPVVHYIRNLMAKKFWNKDNAA